jgi:hypothetical protein
VAYLPHKFRGCAQGLRNLTISVTDATRTYADWARNRQDSRQILQVCGVGAMQ